MGLKYGWEDRMGWMDLEGLGMIKMVEVQIICKNVENKYIYFVY
jgi:hypothetical protein